jgi:hypothetical protein
VLGVCWDLPPPGAEEREEARVRRRLSTLGTSVIIMSNLGEEWLAVEKGRGGEVI